MGLSAVLIVLLLAAPAPQPDLQPGEEHLPLRVKPPAPRRLPAGMPSHAERLGTPPASEADRLFDGLADQLLAREFLAEPIVAHGLGVRDYDAILPPTDTLGIAQDRAARAQLVSRVVRLDAVALEPARRTERERLLTWLAQRDSLAGPWWQRDPGRSIAIVSEGLNAALEGDLPIEKRGWNAIARLTAVPGVLRNARDNLTTPARADVEAAIPEARALAEYLSNRMPVQMAPAKDPVMREEFDHHLAAAVGAAADFHGWLGSTLLPRAGAGPSAAAKRASERALDRQIMDLLLHPPGGP